MIKTTTLIAIILLSGLATSAQTNLSKKEAAQFAATELQTQMAQQKTKADAEWAAKQIQYKNFTMKFTTQIFGDKPADGRSLYISLHGGGGTTTKENDQQWENQKRLYKLKEGVYFVPRAPVDAWNMWHDYPIDELFSELIKSEIVMDDVNPDKIYVMGYSAGGDGVFQLAPRLADYWGAAAMMAGHPGDAQILNLKNIPFDAFVGGKDAAYHRNELVAQWGARLDSLQKVYPGSFTHRLHVYPDLPHWMNRKDTIAVPWLASFKRNPLPKDVIWIQDDILRDQFYWLGTDIAKAKQGQKVRVAVSGNDINIIDDQDEVLYIYLNDDLVNLDKKVSVSVNGKQVFNKRVSRNADIIKQSISARLDKGLIFSGKLVVKNGQVSGS
ncbi:alpha/beta hydrolase [Mucilaginibacter sp. dw_454]|uniref:alpha/beta hydrolase n=1 Tax=Mucilaginibacter sp. dw_454 TaxID=2720079 RepID=UPI001BD3B301|nr:alpha/beta hydrolase [Mucilaginibacter sp. dw_454]